MANSKLTCKLDDAVDWVVRNGTPDSPRVMADAQLRNSQHIYHLLPWPYAKKILDNRQFRLAPVDAWKDPYERWCYRQIIGKSNAMCPMRAYALCWTTGRYDEPFWRIAAFRCTSPIVRIRSSVSSVLNIGARSTSGGDGSLYLGKVLYRPASVLKALGTILQSEPRASHVSSAATMLLHKRNAFRFEKEVRLLWLDNNARRDAFFINIGHAKVVTQVMVSPYTDPSTARSIKSYVRNLGIECKRSAVMDEIQNPVT